MTDAEKREARRIKRKMARGSQPWPCNECWPTILEPIVKHVDEQEATLWL